ncbi:histone H1 [Mesorhizobium sp. M7A.F.Ca.US.008.03.1.1]|nr:histone H1 [Mesorhizobium sp. M7A.F.Ca.US.008.03.1.1]
MKSPKRPRDPNELAKLIADIATGTASDNVPSESPMASLGRSGGLKGGAARAESLSPERRRDIAKRAASSRWGKPK